MGKSKYDVQLTADQRSYLEGFVRRGKFSAPTIRHAYILLYADQVSEKMGGDTLNKMREEENLAKYWVLINFRKRRD